MFWVSVNLLSAVSIAASIQLLIFDRDGDSEPYFTPVAAVRAVARLVDDLIHDPIDPALYAMAENLLAVPRQPLGKAADLSLAGDRPGDRHNARQFIAVMQQGIRARRPGADRDRLIERIVSIALEADLPEEAMRFLTGFTYRERQDDAVQMVFDYSLENAHLELARNVAERFSYQSDRERALEQIIRLPTDRQL